jgi:hypothetical protein
VQIDCQHTQTLKKNCPSALAGNGAVLEVVPMLDPIDHVDITGIQVAQTQTSVDRENVDTSNDEGVRPDSKNLEIFFN